MLASIFFALGGALWEDSSLKTETNIVVVSLQLKFRSPDLNNPFSSMTARMASSPMFIRHWLMNWCICQRFLGDTIQPHDFKYHQYADNSPISISSLHGKLNPVAYLTPPLGYIKGRWNDGSQTEFSVNSPPPQSLLFPSSESNLFLAAQVETLVSS